MAYSFQITVPGNPENLNQVIRMNRMMCNRRKRYWHNVIHLLCVGIKRPKKPLSKFKITIVRYSPRMLDYDGLVGSMKPLVDGLKHSGIIKDDAYKMTGTWEVSQVFDKEKYVEIRIDEL